MRRKEDFLATCVPIRDMRDTAAFARLVAESPGDITVTRNGRGAFVCVRADEYRRLKQADVRARIMSRIAVSERERTEGAGSDAFEDVAAAREEYGL